MDQPVALISGNDTLAENSQFVSFLVGEDRFASAMAPVQEIIRVPVVAQIPMAPPAFLGLANLRGRVLPILSLRRIFGLPEQEVSDTERALVMNLGSPVGFVVDRVASVLTCDKNDLEPAENFDCAVDKEFLTGVIKTQNSSLTMVLDFSKILAGQFAAGVKSARSDLGSTGGTGQIDDHAEADLEGLVSFTVAGQEYAVPIAMVQEIVQAPSDAVRVPNVEPHVLGLTTLRSRVLPLVSLRRKLGLDFAPLDARQRVVVISLNAKKTAAFVADTVDEVLRVQKAEIEPLPALLSNGRDRELLSALLKMDQGKRLVSVLDVAKLFDDAGVSSALAEAGSAEDLVYEERKQEGTTSEDEQFVIFQMGREEFGVPIETVQEIVRLPDKIARIPRAPAFVEGVMNLRGSVLPVIDQRKRFGLAAAERNERQRILVYTLSCGKVGFIVDSVSEVLRIRQSAIESAPAVSAKESQTIQRVANLESSDRLIFLISPESLLDKAEARTLKEAVEAAEHGAEGAGGR
jgi:purine-binding chemotaxis protein CheW